MRARPEINRQIKIHHSARAQKNRRAIGRQARAVGGDEYIGTQLFAMRRTKCIEPWRAHFLAGFHEYFQIEAELAAHIQYALDRADIDRVLAFVIGRAAAIQSIILFDQSPRTQAFAPLRVLSANHVAVGVHHDIRQCIALVARGDQKGVIAICVFIHFADESERLQ